MHVHRHPIQTHRLLAMVIGLASSVMAALPASAEIVIAQAPLFVSGVAAPPLTMLILGRDHTLYYEAYNDASDLNGDGVLDVGYKPDSIDYYGYFDSNLCYTYSRSDDRFNPSATANHKKCSGAWSGDFLNYVTTARIDALRRVLYGGHRVADTNSLTVLERSYIPQDAHSWGKEYESVARDGYNIADYTPLSLPAAGTRHLFANTTLLKVTDNKNPLLRVLTDSKFRIWEWVAIERPVAGNDCVDHSTRCAYDAKNEQGNSPANAAAYQALLTTWATETQRCGSGPISGGNINTTSVKDNNPFTSATSPPECKHDYYLTLIKGQIQASVAGDYQFATNGDDAVQLLIDGAVITGWYGGHSAKIDQNLADRASNTGSVVTVDLTAGWHDFEFRHQEGSGNDSYQLLWKPPGGSWAVVPASELRLSEASKNTAPTITTYSLKRTIPASVMTDYRVQVRVCDPDYPETHCKQYPSGTWKPTGLLQKYGEADQMRFGLISGAFKHPYNMQGGVLRKNIESFRNELDTDSGIFKTDAPGIVRTIDRFRIVDFNMTGNYEYQGGWLTTGAMSGSSSQFPDWGNPIGEMMYESLRYFSGKTSPTSSFMPALTSGNERVTLRDYYGDSTMDLPAPNWKDPYTRTDNPAYYCSPGAQLVISDVNTSYDTESVPGSYFNAFSGDISGLNAVTEANAIWNAEHGGSSLHFIGQSGTDYDGAPSAKTVTSLGNIRGLAPSAPTKQGGYYAAAIARYGFLNDLRSELKDKQNINTFAVALASPLPKIEIPVGSNRITLVPFAKSVGGNSISAKKGDFQPTDQIVDFFIDQFANTDPKGSDANANVNGGRPYVKFRINYEDVEQGADHDMDAIVVYEARVNGNGTLTVDLTSEYAAGGIMQHMGYVISGTTADGVYLEVRDLDTSSDSDPAYFLNTPPNLSPGDCAVASPPTACRPLPFTASRTFSPQTGSTAATILENPLWYAAKYGSKGNEELKRGETSPNYFLVTNAGKLQEQLEKAFQQILLLGQQTGTSAAASSAVLQLDTLLYTAGFRPEDWSGTFVAREIQSDGSLSSTSCPICWDAEKKLKAMSPDDRNIVTVKVEKDAQGVETRTAVDFQFDNLSATQQAALNRSPTGTAPDNLAEARVNWLRGDDTADTSFRSRLSDAGDLRLLGDVVNSNPQFISHTYSGISLLLGAPLDRDRPDAIYIGANDGMLHAFKASDGTELFAFIPSALLELEANASFSRLTRLMAPDYPDSVASHRYSVDGTPAIDEVCIDCVWDTDTSVYSSGTWKTVLVGSQGAGGRSVFALDVTDPAHFDTDSVLWEFNDPDLGYNVGQPAITRLRTEDGTYEWVALFGNGYNSNSHRAFLFVVRISDGQLIAKIDTGEGSSGTPNGLASPKWTNWPSTDLSASLVYAGDLLGNLWRFDISATDKNDWTVSRLFTAKDSTGAVQPITVRPSIATAPNEDNTAIIAFGTGSYFRMPDASDSQTQTLYGIRDTATGTTQTVLRSELLQQSITAQNTVTVGTESYILRLVSDNSFTPPKDKADYKGWYLDLNWESGAGERVISEATFPSGSPRKRVRFTTMIPDADVCGGGRRGFLYDLDLLSGGRVASPVFDLNSDNVFNNTDTVSGTPPSAMAFGSGERLTVIQVPGKNIEYGYDGGGNNVRLQGGGNLLGRQSWEQCQ